MPALPRSVLVGAALSGLLVVAPASAGAKKHSVRIKMNSKAQSLTGPVKLQAVPRGKKPRKVTFAIDGRRKYVARQAPYRFGGAAGNLDPGALKNGKHRITVRAYFGQRRVVKATTMIRVRRQLVPAPAPVDPAIPPAPPIEQVIVTTTLPSAGGSTSEAASWDGSADRGFAPWGQIQDGIRDSQFGSTAISIANSPTSPGHKAFKFDVNGGTSPNGPRAELLDTYALREGMTWWFGDVLYIPSNPTRSIGWSPGHHTVLQFKNEGTGSPPLNFDIRNWGPGNPGNGLMAQGEEPGGLNYRLLVPMATLYDRPIPIETRVKFSSNPNVGEYEVWVDGNRVAGPVKMATLYPGLVSVLKQGQYGESPGTVVYWHGAKRGSTRASVRR